MSDNRHALTISLTLTSTLCCNTVKGTPMFPQDSVLLCRCSNYKIIRQDNKTRILGGNKEVNYTIITREVKTLSAATVLIGQTFTYHTRASDHRIRHAMIADERVSYTLLPNRTQLHQLIPSKAKSHPKKHDITTAHPSRLKKGFWSTKWTTKWVDFTSNSIVVLPPPAWKEGYNPNPHLHKTKIKQAQKCAPNQRVCVTYSVKLRKTCQLSVSLSHHLLGCITSTLKNTHGKP